MESLISDLCKEKHDQKITEFIGLSSFEGNFLDKIYKTVRGYATLGNFDKDRFIDFLNLIAIDYYASYDARGFNPTVVEAKNDINRRINYFLRNNSPQTLLSIQTLYDDSFAYVLYRIQEKIKRQSASIKKVETVVDEEQKETKFIEYFPAKAEAVAKKEVAAKKKLVLDGYPDFDEYDDRDDFVIAEEKSGNEKQASPGSYFTNEESPVEANKIILNSSKSTKAPSRDTTPGGNDFQNYNKASDLNKDAREDEGYPAFMDFKVIEEDKDVNGYPSFEIPSPTEIYGKDRKEQENPYAPKQESPAGKKTVAEKEPTPIIPLSFRFWDYISNNLQTRNRDETMMNAVYPTVDYLTGKGNREDFRKCIMGIATGIYLGTEKDSYTSARQIKDRVKERVKRFFLDRYVNTDRLLDEFYDNCFVAVVSKIQKWEGEGGVELFIIDNFPAYTETLAKPEKKKHAEIIIPAAQPLPAEPRKTNIRKRIASKSDLIYNITIAILSIILLTIIGAIIYMHNYMN